jgi:hypothetical protein
VTEEMQKQIDDQVAAVTRLHREGQIDDNVFHKCMVAIAYEYAVRDEPLRAAGIIQSIPVEYFREVQMKQMQEDPSYCLVAFACAQRLVADGIIHMGPKFTVNQGPASA